MNNQLKRYDQWIDHENDWMFGEKAGGKYVLFEDVEHLVIALKFYADRCQQVPGTAPQYIEVNNNEVQECFGETARQALSKIGMGE